MVTSYKKETPRAKRYRERALRGERNSSTSRNNNPTRTAEARKVIKGLLPEVGKKPRMGRGNVSTIRARVAEYLAVQDLVDTYENGLI